MYYTYIHIYIYIYIYIVRHGTPKPIWTFGLELQPHNTAHRPNPLVQNWAISLLRPWAQAS